MNMKIIADILAEADSFEKELPPPAPLSPIPEGAAIAAYIDHTLLKAEATAAHVKALCDEGRQHCFAAVCINPVFVPLAAGLLKESPVKVCTVAGFPLGAAPATFKVFEALASIHAGAAEIDMVLNVGAMKGEAYGQVYNEVQAVAQVVHNQGALLKVIFETALLSRREKIIACLVCKAAGADFVKTSTGFGPGGATVEDVDLMYRLVGPQVKVKAAGGIRSLADARAMIGAGASRLGTSAGAKIIQEAIS